MLDVLANLERIEDEGLKIKIGIVGIGKMGKGLLDNIRKIPGMRVAAVATQNIDETLKFAKEIGFKEKNIIVVSLNNYSLKNNLDGQVIVFSNLSTAQEKKVKINELDIEDKLLITDDSSLIPLINDIEVVVDATGKPEVGAQVSLSSLLNKKHVVTLNVETDTVIGPIFKKIAENCGVVYTVSAGDEPAAAKELFNFAKNTNLKVISAGKGKNNPLDRYANPITLKEYSKEKKSNPYMMTSFVDGTKSMIEMACLSNATGLIPDVRGMHGPKVNTKDLVKVLIPKKDGGILNNLGVVDFVIGDLAPGVFLIYTTDSEIVRSDLEYLKNGSGPYFLLYRPYHLASIETPISIAYAAIYNEPTIQPIDGLISEVMTFAKKDLRAGEVLDGIGGYTCYGLIELHKVMKEENYLPIGLSEGCILKRNISKDEPIKFGDVEIKENSTLFHLRKIQDFEIG